MFELVGTKVEVSQEYIGGDFERHETERVVATFDRREDAEDYIERSRLKNRIHVSFGSDIVFRKSSLLCNCESAEVIEKVEPEIPPHNPRM